MLVLKTKTLVWWLVFNKHLLTILISSLSSSFRDDRVLLYLYPFKYLGNKYRINLINNELCFDSTLSGVLEQGLLVVMVIHEGEWDNFSSSSTPDCITPARLRLTLDKNCSFRFRPQPPSDQLIFSAELANCFLQIAFCNVLFQLSKYFSCFFSPCLCLISARYECLYVPRQIKQLSTLAEFTCLIDF